jgi:hypothetical protein
MGSGFKGLKEIGENGGVSIHGGDNFKKEYFLIRVT